MLDTTDSDSQEQEVSDDEQEVSDDEQFPGVQVSSDELDSDVDDEPVDDAELYVSKSGDIWNRWDHTVLHPGRRASCNVMRNAPGLTGYSHQRIRDTPILDCFLIIFSNGNILYV